MPADEVLTMGRIGVDLYPMQVGVSLREIRTFGKFLGGSPTNVAVAAAWYGRRSAVISRTGDDPFGQFIHDALRGFGVDDRYVGAVPGPPRRNSRAAAHLIDPLVLLWRRRTAPSSTWRCQ